MKIDGGLVVFIVLIALVMGVSMALGSYDPITPAVAHGEMQMTVGDGWTTGIGTAFNWIFKLALGAVFTGFGVAAFREAHKAYKLWTRNAQAGRWQGGPNANWQRPQQQGQGAKLSRQDMLLLALSGRLPGADASGKVPFFSAASMPDEDQLDIKM